jgi:predicted 2-oxoglutarate/Fe(II)-dependent dioxygenase YbiX
MPVIVTKNFISEADCKRYAAFLDEHTSVGRFDEILTALGYESSMQASTVSKETGVLFGNESPVNKELGAVFDEAKSTARQNFNMELDLCNANYAVMLPGGSIPLHSDTTKLDGSPLQKDGSPEEIERSGILYLNTQGVDFEGGTLFFPELEIEYTPEAGDLVIFESDLKHRHDVAEVLSGRRETIVFFWGRKGNISDRNFMDVDYN